MLRPVLETLMGKLGINTFVQKLDPLADLFSNPRPLSEHEKEIFEREIEVSYQRFLHIVSEGRSLPMDRTAEVAGGRVWLATQAKEEGLVDAIGGCGEAVDLLRAVAGASGRTELGLVDAPRRLLSGWRDWEQEKPKDKASRLIEQFAQYIDLAGDRPRALYLASDLPTDL